MSQHTIPAQYQGRPVRVVAGWDRPLRGFFLVIARTDAATHPADDTDDEDGPILYSNLSDPELLECGGHPDSFAPFLGVLARFGITLAEEVIDSIELDGYFNVGNRFVHYDADGRRLEPDAGRAGR